MARSIAEIQQSILDGFAADPVISLVATNTSKVGLFRLVARIVAVCAWTVEVLFDTFRSEVNEVIATKKPHNERWYASIAKAFQYGYALPPDTDIYDNSALTPDEIAASQIIKYVAVRTGSDRIMHIKVAKQAADLTPLNDGEKAAFAEYMKRVKDAGVKLDIQSNAADSLKAELDIYYDPLILNSEGQRIDGSNNTPVQDATDAFLKNLPFNGTFVLSYWLEALQQVTGVVIPSIKNCETKFGGFDFSTVNVQYLPNAGYLRFATPDDLTINFIPQSSLS